MPFYRKGLNAGIVQSRACIGTLLNC